MADARNTINFNIFVAGLTLTFLSFIQSANAVYGGEIVTDKNILRSVVQIGGPTFACTGVLIDSMTILTVAHCVEDETGKQNPTYILQFGPNGNTMANFVSIGFYQSSRTSLPGDDVALVFPFSTGKNPLTNSQALEIDKLSSITENDDICVVGVGESADIKSVQSLKIHCGLKIPLRLGGVGFLIDPSTNSQVDGPGDSGGPVLKRYPDGTYKVIGLVARGKDGGQSTSFTDLLEGPGSQWLAKHWSK